MNDDNQENSRRRRSFRYAVVSLTALLVLSLGFALIPADPPPPPVPPFSEQARAAALEDALELRTAALNLTSGTADGGAAADVVTLLTIQARALVAPESGEAATAAASPAATEIAPTPSEPSALTAAELASALAASGSERLRDSQTADGGMARLLAGAGTAQVLAARELASAAGQPDAVPEIGTSGSAGSGNSDRDSNGAGSSGTGTDSTGTAEAQASAPADPATSPEACPFVPSDPESAEGRAPANEQSRSTVAAGPGAALAAAAAAELEAVYGYQATLPRLPAEAAGPASEFLVRHQALVEDAESNSRLWCAAPAPQPAGYAVEPDFLAAPVAGLARLEAAALSAYGDAVALTDGPTRAWALAALQETAARTVHWGGDPGPIPGLDVDEAQLPALPAAASTPLHLGWS